MDGGVSGMVGDAVRLDGLLGMPGEMLQALVSGLVLCLVGWLAWRLSSLDEAVRRRNRLFPGRRGEAPDGGQPVQEARRSRRWHSRGRFGRRYGRCRGQRRCRGYGRRSGRRLGRRWGGRSRLGPAWLRTPPPPELLLLPLGLLAAWPTHSPLVAAAAAGAVVPAIRLRSRKQRATLREQRRGAVVGMCAALAGELRTGATPQQAARLVGAELATDGRPADGARGVLGRWGRSRSAGPPLDSTLLLAAVLYGGSVPEAFRAMAALPGAEGAAGIAACWQVASSSGAGLAAGLDRVAEGLRAERALHETVRAELAGPRSTAALLAALPLFGLLLGAGLGADPLRMLLHTPSGLACLALGALLECTGIAWTGRIARGAELAVPERPDGSGPDGRGAYRSGPERSGPERRGGGSWSTRAETGAGA